MFQQSWIWLALLAVPLGAASGLVSAKKSVDLRPPPSGLGFFCPLTGEKLPCERCCPLHQDQENLETSAVALGGGTVGVNDDVFQCPITGEALPCPRCCPLPRNN
jgi:hypothetical protein